MLLALVRERMASVTIAFLIASKLSVNIIGGGLLVLGIVLLIVTLAFWRSATVDHAVLAPLEIMADRSFARANESRRLGMLNQMRPKGAAPIVQHAAPPVLMREPHFEPERSFHNHVSRDDDAVDVLPPIIDPLLSQHQSKE